MLKYCLAITAILDFQSTKQKTPKQYLTRTSFREHSNQVKIPLHGWFMGKRFLKFQPIRFIIISSSQNYIYVHLQ
jgi:hypothetical protein